MPPIGDSGIYDEVEFDEEDEFVEEFEEEEEVKGEEIPMFDEDGEPIIRTREEIDALSAETAESRSIAVPPFLATVKTVPTKWEGKTPDKSTPNKSLELEWVYGYRCHDSRNNIVVNSNGEIVYPTASLVIALDAQKRQQRFFKGHDDDVLCLAQDPTNPDIIVTGQIATVDDGRSQKPSFCITNTKTGQVQKVDDAGERAIRAIGVSCDGNYIATAGCDDKYSITVWDAKTLTKICTAGSAANTVLQGITFHPTNPFEFASIGTGHLSIWTVDVAKGRMTGKSCLTNMPKQIYTAVAYTGTGNQLLVGGKDGGLYVLVNGQAKGVFRVHEGKVNSIVVCGDRFLTGGDDGRVCLVDKSVKPIWQAQLKTAIRAIYCDADGNVTIGTRGGSIHSISAASIAANEGVCVGETAFPAPAMQGHFDGELWGVAVHPRDSSRCATVGEDNSIFVWDVKKRCAIASAIISSEKGRMPKVVKAASTSDFPVNQRGRAISYSPDGKTLAIGTNDGVLHVLNAETLTEVKKIDLNKYGKRKIDVQSQNWIEAISYSPSGRTLAVGTHGICICLLSVNEDYKIVGVMKEHTAAILSLDWSADCKALRSVSLSYELLYHTIDEDNYKKCSHQPSAKMAKDVTWASTTVKFDWSVMGIWKKKSNTRVVEYFFIQGVDVNPQQNLVATGSHDGVSLFRYPCVNEEVTQTPENGMRHFSGHSSHIPRVKFSSDGKNLFSTGGEDKSLFQWKVVDA